MSYRFKTIYGNSQVKTATPTTSSQDIIPDVGYLLSGVRVNAIQTETKTATSNGIIYPSSGKFLTSVTVSIPIYNWE